MGIEHPNADVGAEMDTHRESIKNYNSIVTHDEHDKKITPRKPRGSVNRGVLPTYRSPI